MNNIIIGNIVFLIASTISTIIGLVKDKKKYLLYQLIVFVFMGLGNVLLKGYSGFIANIISIIRNIVCLEYVYTKTLKYSFVVIQAIITIIFNTEGIVGLLPIIAVGVYTLLMDENDGVKFKYVIILSQSCWIIYDFIIHNYVDIVFGLFTIATNLYTSIKIKKKTQSKKQCHDPYISKVMTLYIK